MNEALIVIDVQNDFCPGGALAVADGDAVVDPINRMIEAAPLVVLTQDWHPVGHSSFYTSHSGKSAFDTILMPYGQQTLWPPHCVQGTEGADFHPGLNSTAADAIIRKGMHPQIDSYSTFFENDRITPTGLIGFLRERNVTSLKLVGLATDFCVAYSALDAAHEGFDVKVDLAACRAIDPDGACIARLEEMRQAGVEIVSDA